MSDNHIGIAKILLILSLFNCSIASWKYVSAMSTFPSLCMVRLTQIPLFAGKGASEVRPLVIGRLKALTFFNGSSISSRERNDAEKLYLRLVIRELEMADNEEEKISLIKEDNPRFNELHEQLAAELLPMGKAESSGGSIASDLISIIFKNLSFSSNGSLEPLHKKLPKTLSIARLRLMVKQLFGLEPRLQLLSMRIGKDAFPTVLDDDLATLQYYGAIDGAEIFINEAKG